jgi:hypothetical protein
MPFELTQLQAITDDYVEKSPVDIFFEDCVLLYMLMSGGKFQDSLVQPGEMVDGGEKIRVFLEYAMSHAGSYGNTTKIPQSKVDILNAARFRWAAYFSSNTIDFNERRTNSGKAMLVDLAFTKLRNIQKSIRDKMGTEIYASAADTDSFLGLGNLFNTNTAAEYGSITEADMSNWKANVITDAEAISFAVMQKIKRTASIGQSKAGKPNLYITTDLLKDGFERTLQVQARYSDVSMVNAGFDNVLFAGVPVVADDKQAAGYMDALNLRHLSCKTHSDFAFTKPKWEYSKDQPDTLTANVRWSGQLTTNNRKAHCRHTSLSEPT